MEKYRKSRGGLEIKADIFYTSLDLLAAIEKNVYDIYILDIYIDKINGIELAQTIKKNNEDAQIIFMTSSNAFYKDAFRIHAVHYLEKPILEEDFFDALDRVCGSCTIIRYDPQELPAALPDGPRDESSVESMIIRRPHSTLQRYMASIGRPVRRIPFPTTVYIRNTGDPEAPLKTLRAFQRIEIAPGQTMPVEMKLNKKSFEFFDNETNTVHTKPGIYQILYGSSSQDKDLKALTVSID